MYKQEVMQLVGDYLQLDFSHGNCDFTTSEDTQYRS